MQSFALLLSSVLVALHQARSANILLGNDDGWAEANVRAFWSSLTSAGHNVVLSAPPDNKSGSSSLDLPATTVGSSGCEFDSCAAGSPAEGFNASNTKLNYVNSYPVTAINYGLNTLSPNFFADTNGVPEVVVTGPNVGLNTGISVEFSGTVGAAAAGAKAGIPAIAFSGDSGSQVSYTELPTGYSETYASLATAFVQQVLDAAASPLLPAGVLVNVNYPATDKGDDCTNPSYVLTRAFWTLLHEDYTTCDNDGLLPTESDVMDADGCFASVSVLSDSTKLDASATIQGEVAAILGDLLTCLPS